ncbi:MAG: hypothetical protein KBS81_02360 [Spirochaetales bacterium]|nr:hypothetical protein [Candidatus Physcosoma equi]
MKKIWISLFLLFCLLFIASCGHSPRINEVVLDDQAILLKKGQNQISFKDPEDKILCTLAFYNPSSYPSDENASYSIHCSYLVDNQTTEKGIGDKETVYPYLNKEGMEAELFYISENIRFFFLSGGGYPDIEEATKAYYLGKIPDFANTFEWILKREANLIFGHDYVDVDENGYFSVYLVNDGEKSKEIAGFVYDFEALEHDVFYVSVFS